MLVRIRRRVPTIAGNDPQREDCIDRRRMPHSRRRIARTCGKGCELGHNMPICCSSHRNPTRFDCVRSETGLDLGRVLGVANEEFASTIRSGWPCPDRCPHCRFCNREKHQRSVDAGASGFVRDCTCDLSVADGPGFLQKLQGRSLDCCLECLSWLDVLWLVCGDWMGSEWQDPGTASHDSNSAAPGTARALMDLRRKLKGLVVRGWLGEQACEFTRCLTRVTL